MGLCCFRTNLESLVYCNYLSISNILLGIILNGCLLSHVAEHFEPSPIPHYYLYKNLSASVQAICSQPHAQKRVLGN